MTHSHTRGKKLDITSRRHQIAALMLAGVSKQEALAERVGVDQSTISRDIAAIEHDWKIATCEDIAKAKGKDLARIERVIQGLWPSATSGHLGAVDRVVKLLQHRAKLLGLYAPEKREHSGPDGAPLIGPDITMYTRDELRQLAEIEARALARVRG